MRKALRKLAIISTTAVTLTGMITPLAVHAADNYPTIEAAKIALQEKIAEGNPEFTGGNIIDNGDGTFTFELNASGKITLNGEELTEDPEAKNPKDGTEDLGTGGENDPANDSGSGGEDNPNPPEGGDTDSNPGGASSSSDDEIKDPTPGGASSSSDDKTKDSTLGGASSSSDDKTGKPTDGDSKDKEDNGKPTDNVGYDTKEAAKAVADKAVAAEDSVNKGYSITQSDKDKKWYIEYTLEAKKFVDGVEINEETKTDKPTPNTDQGYATSDEAIKAAEALISQKDSVNNGYDIQQNKTDKLYYIVLRSDGKKMIDGKDIPVKKDDNDNKKPKEDNPSSTSTYKTYSEALKAAEEYIAEKDNDKTGFDIVQDPTTKLWKIAFRSDGKKLVNGKPIKTTPSQPDKNDEFDFSKGYKDVKDAIKAAEAYIARKDNDSNGYDIQKNKNDNLWYIRFLSNGKKIVDGVEITAKKPLAPENEKPKKETPKVESSQKIFVNQKLPETAEVKNHTALLGIITLIGGLALLVLPKFVRERI